MNEDCTSPECRRVYDPKTDTSRCIGVHCRNCKKPSGQQGHYFVGEDGEFGFQCD